MISELLKDGTTCDIIAVCDLLKCETLFEIELFQLINRRQDS